MFLDACSVWATKVLLQARVKLVHVDLSLPMLLFECTRLVHMIERMSFELPQNILSSTPGSDWGIIRDLCTSRTLPHHLLSQIPANRGQYVGRQSTMFAIKRSVPMSVKMQRTLDKKRTISAADGPTKSQIGKSKVSVLLRASSMCLSRLKTRASILSTKASAGARSRKNSKPASIMCCSRRRSTQKVAHARGEDEWSWKLRGEKITFV